MTGPSNNTGVGTHGVKRGELRREAGQNLCWGDLELRIPPSAPGTLLHRAEQSIQGLGSVLASTGGQGEVHLAEEQHAGTGGCGVAPEVVALLLQLEGVVRSAVRAPDVQVAVPEDTDAYSTTLHTAHRCSAGTRARPLP